jgi:hypothetical protein
MKFGMRLTRLPEAMLEFGGAGEFLDPKIGLREAGPFDLRFGAAHKEQVRVGFVGPRSTMIEAKRWFERVAGPIEGAMRNLMQYPRFPGFEAVFHSKLVLDVRFDREFDGGAERLAAVLAGHDKPTVFQNVLDMYGDAIAQVGQGDVRPDIVVCCLPDEVLATCWSVTRRVDGAVRRAAKKLGDEQIRRQLGLFEGLESEAEEMPEDLLVRDFRRALKARAMHAGVPIQLVTSNLVRDGAKQQQDAATRAWNSAIALYYKAGGIPWRLRLDGPATCFIGIGFFHWRTTRRHLVRSSIAQAFSSAGEGFALRGEALPWDESMERRVHLSSDYAKTLGESVLQEYVERTGILPARVVLHKTSVFDAAEAEGFHQAFRHVPIVELLNLLPTPFRVLRFGNYPIARGTLCTVNDSASYLFTTGYMSELGTYPGPHIPAPIEIRSWGGVNLERAAADILALTRMNWNTGGVTSGVPVTLSFARRVGGIMAEFGEAARPPVSFRYYM